jgi:hypothetical protein
MAMDESGTVTVGGWTLSTDFPTTPQACQTTYQGGDSDGYVSRLSLNGNGAADLLYSTFLGGSSMEGINGVAAGSSGDVTVTGTVSSADFPTTPDAYDRSHNGADDAFVVRLDPTLGWLVYSTFLGGSANDWGASLTLDGPNAVIVSGSTQSTNLPTTGGAYDDSHNGGYDAFICRFGAISTAVSDESLSLSVPPGSICLGTPEPNPTTGGLSYSVDLDRATRVRVNIFDVRGRLVTTLFDGLLLPGRHAFRWTPDGADTDVPSGTYYLRLSADGEQRIRKFVLVR